MTKRSRSRAVPVTFACVCVASCGGEPVVVSTGVEAADKPTSTAEPPPPPFTSPARWSFHPRNPLEATSTTKLADGSCLITTLEGFRFQAESATAQGTCSGKTKAAPDSAPETLVGVVKRSERSYLFVGRSGALYEAEAPLAPLQSAIAAPSNLTSVAGGMGTVLATTPSGELLRLSNTDGWKPIQVPDKRLGIYDVAVDDEGHALALALPEMLLFSEDGSTFKQAKDVPTVGVRKLGQTPEGNLVALGVTGAIVWEPKKSKLPEKTQAALVRNAFTLDLEETTNPTATSILDGSAALDGERYYEIIAGEEREELSLATGTLEGPLNKTPIRGTKSCRSGRIGVRGKHVAFVCITTPDDDDRSRAELRLSHDGGNHFDAPIAARLGDKEIVHVAVSSEGAVLVTGLCKQQTGAGDCTGSAPLFISAKDAALPTPSLNLSATPPLRNFPITPAFSPDGGSAYFLGRRAKDEQLALFVSHDGGATFVERSLGRLKGQTGVESSEEGAPSDDVEGRIDVADLTTLRIGEDGTLGVVLTTDRGLAYFTADEDGRVLGIGHAPTDAALLSGAGRRVLATAVLSGHERVLDDAAGAWESNDGGLSWNEIPTNLTLARELLEGSETIACSTSGCLIGIMTSRVGWQGQTSTPALAAPRAPELRQRPLMRTPLVCELDPTASWTRIDNIDPISSFGLPTVDQLARGKSLWSVLSVDPTTNAVTATAAIQPDRGDAPPRVTTRPLLGPTPKDAHVALDVSHQMEGYAAVRVRLSKTPSLGDPLRDLEVAWENFIDGTQGKARIPDAGKLGMQDIKPDANHALLDTGLISVTPSALFLRPHSAESSDRLTFLLDTRGKRTTFTYPNWSSLLPPAAPTELRSDAALIDGRPLAVATVLDDEVSPLTMLLSVQGTGDAWITTATTLGPGSTVDNDRLARNDWTYLGTSSIGTILVQSEPQTGNASASFHSFRPDGSFGAPVLVPTPFDLADPPRPCKAEERRATPRFAAHAFAQGQAMFPGRRHPVLVSESPKAKGPLTEPMALLTAGQVLYGTKASPCVAAYEAFGTTISGSFSSRAPIVAVISGDGTHAFLFRVAEPSQDAKSPTRPSSRDRSFSIEHRPMSCHFDATAAIPPQLVGQAGTTVWAGP